MTTATPRPLIIVTGYLGAGKTTVIRSLLPTLDALGKRGLLLMNEVGDINLDGAALGDTALEQRELLGGCVCCDLRGDLYHAIREGLHTYNPDYLILETSGLAEPADVIDAATAPKLRGVIEVTDVVTVIDAANLERCLRLGPLAREQAAFASALILNKVDSVSVQELESAKRRSSEFAPNAVVHLAAFGEVPTEAVLANALHLLKRAADSAQGKPPAGADGAEVAEDHEVIEETGDSGAGHDHHHHHHHEHAHRKFFALTYDLLTEVSQRDILPTLKSLPENAYRVKGFARVKDDAQPWIFQRVGGVPPQATPFALEGIEIPIGMVVIGPHLDADAITSQLAPLGATLRHTTN